jgi:lipopolysaccharide export system permease protein
MWILSRSIARHFLTNALLLYIFLCVVILAVDVSLNIDEFVKNARALLRLSTPEPSSLAIAGKSVVLIADLWWPRFFLLFSALLGPVLIGALGFTGSYLMKHRELVAMIASGISLRRVATPILLCTTLLLAAQVAVRELVLPRIAPLLVRDKQDIGGNVSALTRSFLRDTEGRLWYIQRAAFDKAHGAANAAGASLTNVYIYERDAQGLMTRRISAPNASWLGEAWQLQEGRAVSRAPVESAAGPVKRVALSTIDAIASSVTPTTLRMYRWDAMASNLSSAQLRELLTLTASASPTPAEARRHDGLIRILLGRWSSTLCVLLSVIMAIPLFLRKEPANMVRQTLIAAPQSLAAFALALVGTTIDLPGIPPGVSVFLPVMVLIPAGIIAWGSIRT